MMVLTQAGLRVAAARVAERLIEIDPDRSGWNLYGVPRGGIPAAYLVGRALLDRDCDFEIVDRIEDADAIIDDIVDSGATRERYRKIDCLLPFCALYDKLMNPLLDWLVFPWEGTEQGSAEDIPRRLLQYVGEDTNREGLKETPARFLRAWQHYTKGYKEQPADVLKVFQDGADKVDEMVLVRDIPVYSHCEHHLAPFFGVAHVAYIPNGKVVGLSKLARLVDVFARRLQVQERLTQQIAHALNDALRPTGVGVVVNCRHMCMEARGVQRQGSSTLTSCLLGAIKEEDSARAEFLQLVAK